MSEVTVPGDCLAFPNPSSPNERPRYRIVFLVISLGAGLLTLLPSWAWARESSPKDDKTRQSSPEDDNRHPAVTRPGPQAYCGVQSLYRAVRALGKEVTFTDLVKPEYISSKKGSSAADLKKAGESLEVFVQPMSRMTCGMLRNVNCPVILHIKPSVDAKEYNHWVLCMGTEGGKATIYDGEQPEIELGFDELAAQWDGVGLLVSDSPISTTRIRLISLGPFLLCAGLVAFAVGVLFRLERRWKEGRAKASWAWSVSSSIGQAAGLLLITLAAMAGYRVGSDAGYLSNPDAIAAIQDSNFGTFLPKVNTAEMARLLDTPGVAIVDARFPSDFAAGHIKGAINIPVNSNREECEMAMTTVPKEFRIVVYSHSNGCHYDENVAKELISLGYENILNFAGGWVEWEKQHPLAPKSRQLVKGEQG